MVVFVLKIAKIARFLYAVVQKLHKNWTIFFHRVDIVILLVYQKYSRLLFIYNRWSSVNNGVSIHYITKLKYFTLEVFKITGSHT